MTFSGMVYLYLRYKEKSLSCCSAAVRNLDGTTVDAESKLINLITQHPDSWHSHVSRDLTLDLTPHRVLGVSSVS
jgi:hypothetical protein